jgi:hypothetical protein
MTISFVVLEVILMAGPAHKTRKIYRTHTLPTYGLQDSTIQPRDNGYGHEKLTWQRYQINAKSTRGKTS